MIGRNDFHVRIIRLSYRMRGRVARTQMNSVAKRIVLRSRVSGIMGLDLKKRIDVRRLMNRMFAYSAMKMKANRPALYSMLKPDTNSDSPSAKSNGDRLVSAKLVINHIIMMGIIIISRGVWKNVIR